MATKATLTLTSPDLVSDNINFSVEATLTQAGNSTDIAASTGLARTNFVAGGSAPFASKVIFRSEDATADGANKIYMKNTSSTATEFFTIFIDQEEMGRLYAGDWAFFPWIASQGTKETFIVTSAGTVAAGDSWDFDGITTTSADANSNNFAAAIHAENYPNWTTTISTAAVTFTAREAGAAGVVTGTTAITGDTITDLASSDLTMNITSAVAGTRSEADIHVVPSVATTMVLEHMLFKQ